MPTYLCHGFRWHRQSIRIFVGMHDLLDASPDWIVGPACSNAIIHQMYELFDFVPTLDSETQGAGEEKEKVQGPTSNPEAEEPSKGKQWSAVELFEEYDPHEAVEATRPYAYVADYAVRVDLSASLTEEMARYKDTVAGLKPPAAETEGPSWFERLRDKLQTDEEIQWYVVVCGDEERGVPDTNE